MAKLRECRSDTFPVRDEPIDDDDFALLCPACDKVVLMSDCGALGADDGFLFCPPPCSGWIHEERDRLPSASVVRVQLTGTQKMLFG
jgi:hypothetical protein